MSVCHSSVSCCSFSPVLFLLFFIFILFYFLRALTPSGGLACFSASATFVKIVRGRLWCLSGSVVDSFTYYLFLQLFSLSLFSRNFCCFCFVVVFCFISLFLFMVFTSAVLPLHFFLFFFPASYVDVKIQKRTDRFPVFLFFFILFVLVCFFTVSCVFLSLKHFSGVCGGGG